MIKDSRKQDGSAHIFIVVILVVAIVGALGFVVWKNFLAPKDTLTTATVSQDEEKPAEETGCESDVVEANGIFCSEEIGVQFQVPSIFKGKFEKAENYDIFEGKMENNDGTSAGKSLEFYKAVITSGQETLSLSVAKEPLRSGYSSIGHSLQRTYFNATTSNLNLVNGPTNEYDSVADTMKTTGGWSEGESVPSFDVSGTKIYYGQIGDAGVLEDGYLMVVNQNLVVIKLKHAYIPGDNPRIEYESSFTALTNYLRHIKVLE